MNQPRVSVATICFDGFGDEDFARTFRYAPELGVNELEVNAWYARNLTPSGLGSILERCGQSGLGVGTLQVSPFAPGPSSADLARETARWLWLCQAAERLGATVIKATGAARGEQGGLPALIELLNLVAPVAADHGLRIAVENHFDNVVEHPEDYRTIFAEVTNEVVGMCLDTGHFIASGHLPERVAEEFSGRVIHVDLKDCLGPGAASFVRFGAGSVDFDAVLETAIREGFEGYIVVELPLVDESTMLSDLRGGVDIATRNLPSLPADSTSKE